MKNESQKLSYFLLFLFLGISWSLSANKSSPFYKLSLTVNHQTYEWNKDTLHIQDQARLLFHYESPQEIAEFRLYADEYQQIKLKESKDFSIIDSVTFVNDQYFRFKIQFKNLPRSRLISLLLTLSSGNEDLSTAFELPLLPTTKTLLSLSPKLEDLFIGEEKIFPLESNYPNNIHFDGQWKKQNSFSFKISKRKGKLFLHIIPNQLGEQEILLQVKIHQPYWKNREELEYQTSPFKTIFNIKPGRLRFLNINQREITVNRSVVGTNLEIELAYDEKLELEKTYRVEAQEKPGGILIAEIFTRSVLNNGRVLCWLRPYNFHRRSEGYLYIKNGDQAVFISNLNIVASPAINSLSLLRENGNWTNNMVVYPGEQLEIKLKGQSLHLADIKFDGLDNVALDSLIDRENEIIFKGQVPIDIRKKKIEIYIGDQRSGRSLTIKELQQASPFDFISLKFGDQELKLSEVNHLLFSEKALQDVTIGFDPNQIDKDKIHGKQYLSIDIRLSGQKNNLIDTRTIQKIVICPGENSPRFNFYRAQDCQSDDIFINRHLRKKVFDLETWSTIELTIRHDPRFHPKGGHSKKVEIITRKFTTFDIDVSFPAGLIVKRAGEEGFGNLSSISMAMIAQFSFYHPERIARFRPYKFGLGFLAFNAFNFNENNNNRDVGIVALASFYPLRPRGSSRLSFPLYIGGGYFLSDEQWFVLLGPGIRIRL